MKQNWTYKKLGEVAAFIGDGDWIESRHQSGSGIRLIQTGNIGNGVFKAKEDKPHYISEQTFNELDCTEIYSGDCLVSRLPDPIGRACIIPNVGYRMITAVDCTIIRFKDTFCSDFFVYYTRSKRYEREINNHTTGSTRKRISRKNLESVSIPLPPLSTQSRIVSELDLLQSLIDKQKAQLKELDTLAQAVFYDMFGDLEASKYTLIELCDSKDDIKCGPFGTQLSKTEYQKSGVAVWGIPQINSHFKIPPSDYVSEEKAINLKDYSVIAGDIVMSRKGNVGQCCVFPKSFSSGIIHSDVLRLRLNPHKADSLFMMYQLHLSKNVKYQIQLVSSGAIMPGINVTKLKNIVVEVPPLPLQQSFAAKIESIEKQKAAISKSIAETEKLFEYTMDKYFG